MSKIVERVAHAICEANPKAGQSHDTNAQQPTASRARNLVRCGYVREGDPQGWGGGSALVTIYLEPKGGAGDCVMPWSYWDDPSGVSIAASSRLIEGSEGDLPLRVYIENVNAAVACVYPV